MSRSAPIRFLGACLAAVSLGLVGCDARTDAPLQPAQSSLDAGTGPSFSAATNQQLAALRRATARYHDFATAYDDGWNIEATPCWFYTGLGAMGYHYLDLDLLDGMVELLKPEALVYEPKQNGGFRLVALEYLVPIDAWMGENPPMLLGQTFADNGAGLYILHVWLWRDNPAGMFADWNSRVSCQYAAASEDRAP